MLYITPAYIHFGVIQHPLLRFQTDIVSRLHTPYAKWDWLTVSIIHTLCTLCLTIFDMYMCNILYNILLYHSYLCCSRCLHLCSVQWTDSTVCVCWRLLTGHLYSDTGTEWSGTEERDVQWTDVLFWPGYWLLHTAGVWQWTARTGKAHNDRR